MAADYLTPEITAALTGVIALLGREIHRSMRYRNGNRAPNEDRVRLIIREETKPLADKVDDLKESVRLLAWRNDLREGKSAKAGM